MSEAMKPWGWQSMKTAPKDGTPILVAFKHIGVRQVAWEQSNGGGLTIWCVDDNKHGPFPLRGYANGDELGWMPTPELTASLYPAALVSRLAAALETALSYFETATMCGNDLSDLAEQARAALALVPPELRRKQ